MAKAKPKIASSTGRKAAGIHAARANFRTGTGAQKATPAAAKPKAPAVRKVATPKVRRESDQELVRRLDAAGYGDAEIGAAIRRGEHKTVAAPGARSRRAPVQISSEQQISTHAAQQSRALSSPSQIGATHAGGGRRGSSVGGSRHAGGGSPLVRSSGGGVNLRGGTGRSFWKRDLIGRFSS